MQEQQSPPSTNTQAAPVSTPKATKPVKNLYEPYVTPAWFWVSLRTVARFVFFLFLNIKLKGRQNVPKTGPYIIASNHLSWADIPLVPAYLSSQVIYLAKEELYQGKMGWVVRFLGAIPVKRGEADRQLLRASDDLLKRGKILVIFPEGHRSKNHQMIAGNAGVGMIGLRAGVPVIPVAVCGSEHALKKFRPPVTITYGEPIILRPAGTKITKDDITTSTDLIMHHIAEMLPPAYRGFYNTVPTQE
ncbi:MAG TPA: lysophospholipid acyltransferase family protein [Ktedonobacteraceae bacterium]